jgi:membrane protein DedA with SNARE-associated domain
MLGIFLSYLLVYKYLVLFLLNFLAALIFPIPASAVLIAAGAFSSQGYFDFRQVFIFGLLGNVLGDISGYLISFYFGRDFLIRIGLKRFLNSKGFVGLENNFIDHAPAAIFFSRFLITALGTPVNILSGLSKISFKKFFLYEFPGEIIYVLALSGLGYIFGIEWESIYGVVEDLTGITIIIALIIVASIFYFKRKRR